jgi:hypothetical protein
VEVVEWAEVGAIVEVMINCLYLTYGSQEMAAVVLHAVLQVAVALERHHELVAGALSERPLHRTTDLSRDSLEMISSTPPSFG